MKSIKQLAEELNVSKTAIRKKIANLGLQSQLQTIGNQFAINEEQEMLIKQAFDGNSKIESQTKSQTKTETSSRTESQTENQQVLDFLTEQLKAKDEQIKHLQQLLDQEQQLHLQTQNKVLMLEANKKESSFWKKLFGN